mgnify:CR=1 FL=1
MKNHNTIVNTENCLFYGLPGIVILAVSLMASTRIGADFGGDTFVKTVSFLGCNGLLWLLYLVLCQYLLADLLAICLPKKKTATVGVLEAKPEAGMTLSETVAEQPTTPTPVLSQEQYQSYCADFERQKQEAREELATSVLGYVNRKMAPFTTEENLAQLCNEVRTWCDNPLHSPKAIRLKPVSNPKDRLRTVDFKHFVWNIGARLGSDQRAGQGAHQVGQAPAYRQLYLPFIENPTYIFGNPYREVRLGLPYTVICHYV